MTTPKFTRTIEDFVCEHCGAQVKGDGYTNHCPECLWSKHVDKNPGDRAADCGGLMAPQYLFIKNGEQYLIHQCVICGYEKNNRLAKNDNFEAVLNLMKGE